MLTRREITDALTGSVMLLRRDLDGYRLFDSSIDGFWRSFAVIILITPVFLVYGVIERDISQIVSGQRLEESVGVWFFAVKTIALAVDWISFPIAMVFLTRILGLWDRYLPYITVYNWTSLFIIVALSPPFVLYSLGLLSANNAVLINLLLTFAVLYFRWFLARTALSAEPAAAAGIVAVDLILSMFIHMMSERIAGV